MVCYDSRLCPPTVRPSRRRAAVRALEWPRCAQTLSSHSKYDYQPTVAQSRKPHIPCLVQFSPTWTPSKPPGRCSKTPRVPPLYESRLRTCKSFTGKCRTIMRFKLEMVRWAQLRASWPAACLISTPRPVRSAPRRFPCAGSCSYGWMSNFRPCYAQTLDFITSQKSRLRSCTTILFIASRKPEFLLICWSRLQMRADFLHRSKSNCVPRCGARHVASRFSYSTPAMLPYNGRLAFTVHIGALSITVH
ncbi:hypothetical protein EDB85DRAFT_250936 [Lactarius pseudohatsudake]|nr:hypothetical protein EDB85DRAFT_250936 [Lactarius pseudohatsudake]